MTSEPVEDRIRQLEAKAQREEQQAVIAQQEAVEAAESRRFITRFILRVFATALTVYAAVAIYEGPAADKLLELIKVAITPLVTLVLGFYLSRSR